MQRSKLLIFTLATILLCLDNAPTEASGYSRCVKWIETIGRTIDGKAAHLLANHDGEVANEIKKRLARVRQVSILISGTMGYALLHSQYFHLILNARNAGIFNDEWILHGSNFVGSIWALSWSPFQFFQAATTHQRVTWMQIHFLTGVAVNVASEIANHNAQFDWSDFRYGIEGTCAFVFGQYLLDRSIGLADQYIYRSRYKLLKDETPRE